MTDIEKMAAMRADRAKSNLDVRPIDLLRAAIHDLETGVSQADGLIISMVYRPPDEARIYDSYRCGLTRDQELAQHIIMQDILLRKWKGQT